METSLPLATDSFSYSWLSNYKSPMESTYSSFAGTSKEFQNFNFDVSVTHESPSVLVHADEIFCDGLIRPLFVDPSSTVVSCDTPDSTRTKPSSSFYPRTVEIHHGFLTRWRKSTRRKLRKIFRYVNRLCGMKVDCSRKSTRVDDIDNTEWQVKSWGSSQQASPKPFPIGDLHHHENSIYEAVLHCKRSIEK